MKKPVLLIVALFLFSTAVAEVTTGTAAESANRANERPSLTNILEKANQDIAGGAGQPGDNAKLLKDHLTDEQRTERAAAIKAAAELRLKKASAADAAKVATGNKVPEEDDWLSSASKTIKDVVRPVKENIDELRKTDELAPLPPVKVPEPIIVVSEEQRKRERMTSSILWEQFVEDIKPWAIGLGILVVLLAIAYQWFRLAAKQPSRVAREAIAGASKRRVRRG